MLRPIPARILRSIATVKVCAGLDRYQNPTWTEYTVKNVHLQPTNEIRKTANNTDCTLRAILFADARRSTSFDWDGQFTACHSQGADMKVTVRGTEYTVFSVDALRDDTDRLHHWEVGLV